VTTVAQAKHIVAQIGIKQVGHVVSAEKGQLITVYAIIKATGNTVPPAVLVFPRARMHDALMIYAAAAASLGLVNCPTSGCMTGPTIPAPESVLPYPKAPERKETIRRRKRRKSRILAATPKKSGLRLNILRD
jgi:hypothetical protein